MDTTPNQSAPMSDIKKRKWASIIAYIGPLVVISYLVSKDDPFVKFHIKQGLVLLVINIAAWLVASMFWPLYILYPFVNLAILLLVVIGIVNVVNDREKELPIVGKFSKYFTF